MEYFARFISAAAAGVALAYVQLFHFQMLDVDSAYPSYAPNLNGEKETSLLATFVWFQCAFLLVGSVVAMAKHLKFYREVVFTTFLGSVFWIASSIVLGQQGADFTLLRLCSALLSSPSSAMVFWGLYINMDEAMDRYTTLAISMIIFLGFAGASPSYPMNRYLHYQWDFVMKVALPVLVIGMITLIGVKCNSLSKEANLPEPKNARLEVKKAKVVVHAISLLAAMLVLFSWYCAFFLYIPSAATPSTFKIHTLLWGAGSLVGVFVYALLRKATLQATTCAVHGAGFAFCLFGWALVSPKNSEVSLTLAFFLPMFGFPLSLPMERVESAAPFLLLSTAMCVSTLAYLTEMYMTELRYEDAARDALIVAWVSVALETSILAVF